jgi:hypothetical protein
MLFAFPSAVHRPRHSARRLPAVLGLAALQAGLLIASPPVSIAQATLGACNGDPVVVLSNGVTIDLYTTIQDDVSDVQQVVYTLHAPSGTGVISVAYTSGLLGPKEVLWFYADNLPDIYDTATIVSTYTTGIAVTTATTAVPVVGISATASTSGFDQENLLVSVTV